MPRCRVYVTVVRETACPIQPYECTIHKVAAGVECKRTLLRPPCGRNVVKVSKRVSLVKTQLCFIIPECRWDERFALEPR